MKAKRGLACGLLLVFAAAGLRAQPASFEAKVGHVSDGDTLWALPLRGGGAERVRIVGIDAPELCQAAGSEARDALAAVLAHEQVRVIAQGHDDFGRTLARIELRGQDIGARLVREGHAWSYRFRSDPGPYLREERLAHRGHLGLWRDAHPMEPRVFRRRHGPCTGDTSAAGS
ncbi:MAG TPA: thermonuclease family protein [Ramlibacter sp.]|uniref:thermonuclease family protein n=1 Tax=Ramlibacter sp. TaxID=1917967 RepID=UPI002C415ACB|nr:thermonuclease family protein [Ramlibacter sp.]HVZ46180.1 thermonuclease family protein [Ramlibacter sp.]